jgi:Uncharacterized protein conserved in bacteria (DUF2155)
MQLMRHALLFSGGMVGALLLLAACGGKEEKTVTTNAHVQGVAKQTTVVETPVSKGKWRAVVIGVTDKQSGKESDHEFAIGSQNPLPNTGLSIEVKNFLPHFIMQGTVLTSQSNEPKNPAVQITVSEGQKEIYKGWLFALYPTTHAFQHPRYGFSLKGCLPGK